MKDTIAKMRALVSMKSTLIEALRSDLEAAARKITKLEAQVAKHEAWWEAMDKDNDYIARLNPVSEYQDGYGPAMLHGEELGAKTSVAKTVDLTENPDGMWNSDPTGPDHSQERK